MEKLVPNLFYISYIRSESCLKINNFYIMSFNIKVVNVGDCIKKKVTINNCYIYVKQWDSLAYFEMRKLCNFSLVAEITMLLVVKHAD